jgi:hypothetical protein
VVAVAVAVLILAVAVQQLEPVELAVAQTARFQLHSLQMQPPILAVVAVAEHITADSFQAAMVDQV